MSEVTQHHKREAIARALGWTFQHVKYGSCGGAVFEDVWFEPGHPFPQTADWIAQNGWHRPPQYDISLSACHVAELALTDEQHDDFRIALREITGSPCYDGARSYVSATAAQRAEALYLALTQNKTP